MRKDTLILFLSDNGGNRSAVFSGEGDVSDLVLPASNAPYRGGKGNLTEGGCRVVALAHWPGRIPLARIDAPVHAVDVLPTFLHAAGLSSEPDRVLDGVNQWETLATGAFSARTEIVYNVEPYRAALSEENWKLLVSPSLPPKIELYDLARDPGETANLAAHHPILVDRLEKRIHQLAAESTPPQFLGYAAKHHDRMKEIFKSMSRAKRDAGPRPGSGQNE